MKNEETCTWRDKNQIVRCVDELIMMIICPETMLRAMIINNIGILSLDSWYN
jgi:hypothetical protein